MSGVTCPPHVNLPLTKGQIREGRAISRECARLLEKWQKINARERKRKRAEAARQRANQED